MKYEQIDLNLQILKIPVSRGFSIIHLSSYTELLQYEDSMKSIGMDFRGQADSRWPLLPGIFRKYPNINNNEIQEMIDSYRKATDKVSFNDDEILAYGQHHGLLTQLLDITQNLRVALYFAFKDEIKEHTHERVSIWVLTVHNLKWAASFKSKNPKLPDLIEPIDYIDKGSERQKNQKGLFFKFPLGCKDFKAWFEEYDDGSNMAKLIQFTIPKKDRINCLNELAGDGITPEYIFPDIEGKTLKINMFREIEGYRI